MAGSDGLVRLPLAWQRAGPWAAERPSVIRIAFAISRLFPGGGLQRDCLAIARALVERGHDVVIFCRARQGIIADLDIRELANRAWTNHGASWRFGRDLAAARAGFDRLVGFNKLPGLDVLYCADPPLRPGSGSLMRFLPRYRAMTALEGFSFAASSGTRLLLLSEDQRRRYQAAWGTQDARIEVLPPNIDRGRVKPELRGNEIRREIRCELGIPLEQWVWLYIGTFPRTKGLDRLLRAAAAFARTQVLVVGVGARDRRARQFVRLARRLDVAARVTWLGQQQDICRIMAACDVLVHPARADVTGTVILEALVNGLPVVTTSVCGFADHVRAADAGIVLPEPFRPDGLVTALGLARDAETAARWSRNAVGYGATHDLYLGIERAADLIADAG